ncbi:MAG TPA: hypothetical protein VN699_03470 [Pirellulales bacterium]|nr:hypothetical protein [Pirellulales bacterium]
MTRQQIEAVIVQLRQGAAPLEIRLAELQRAYGDARSAYEAHSQSVVKIQESIATLEAEAARLKAAEPEPASISMPNRFLA